MLRIVVVAAGLVVLILHTTASVEQVRNLVIGQSGHPHLDDGDGDRTSTPYGQVSIVCTRKYYFMMINPSI